MGQSARFGVEQFSVPRFPAMIHAVKTFLITVVVGTTLGIVGMGGIIAYSETHEASSSSEIRRICSEYPGRSYSECVRTGEQLDRTGHP